MVVEIFRISVFCVLVVVVVFWVMGLLCVFGFIVRYWSF